MGICEAKGISKEEEQRLGLGILLSPLSSSPSSSSAAAVEALDAELGKMTLVDKPEEKSVGDGARAETGWDEYSKPEYAKPEKNSVPAKEGTSQQLCFPQRPGEADCSFYLRTGTCRFGSNCWFNHPPKGKSPPIGKRNKAKSKKPSEPVQMGTSEVKVTSKTEELRLGLTSPTPSQSSYAAAAAAADAFNAEFRNEEKLEEKSDWGGEYPGSEENANVEKHSMSSKAGKIEAVCYPQRPDKPDCSFYLKTGNCQFGSNCKFNHPPKRKTNKVKPKKPSEQIQMRTCEVKVVSKTEELGLGLPFTFPSPSSSATAAAEAFNVKFGTLALEEKLEGKSDGVGYHGNAGSKENANLEKDSTSSKEGKSERFCYPQTPDKPDCSHYMNTGDCQFGLNCKFNHPPRNTRNKVKSKKLPPVILVDDSELFFQVNSKKLPPVILVDGDGIAHIQAVKKKEKESPLEKVGKTEGKKVVKKKKNEALSEKEEQKNCKAVKKKQEKKLSRRMEQTEHKRAAEEKETPSERVGQTECKDYSMPGGCKLGQVCKDVHFLEKSEVGSVELNFLGLPIRPGERECPCYMRTGGCNFATNCRYHHPDPIAVVGQDTLLGYQNGVSPQQHASGASVLPMTSWPFHGASCEPAPFFETPPSYASGFFPLPSQGLYPNPEWNGYQAPTPWLPPELNTRNSSPSTTNDTSNREDILIHQQALVDEYPERPGQPECFYFMQNGDCKFKSACRFHHPKARLQKCL